MHANAIWVPVFLAKEAKVANLRKGTKVSWKSHGGTAEGHVVRKLTHPVTIKGHKAMASKDNPEFLVETDEGKRAAHKAKALKKL
jgi:hypothetical protein